MATVRHHVLDIYGAELHLATDKRQWATLRRRLTFLGAAPESAGLSQFAVFEPNNGGVHVPHIVLWIDKAAHKTTLDVIDTCAHEANHAVGQLFEHIGHEAKGTDEPSAYFAGWLTRWLCEALLEDAE